MSRIFGLGASLINTILHIMRSRRKIAMGASPQFYDNLVAPCRLKPADQPLAMLVISDASEAISPLA